MITVETVLLVGLGVLLAGLLGLLLAPAYWTRAVRITTERIRDSLPITEAEIRAEHGRLRAERALVIHDLRSQLERLRVSSAHTRVDVNRRDAEIHALKGRVEELQTALEVNENARRVLEQTITDRVPDVERHLREAQRSLEQREDEVARLRIESAKAYRALQEAIDIGDKQRAEIEQLSERSETRAYRNAAGVRSADRDSELALRAELGRVTARAKAQRAAIDDLRERLVAHGEKVELPESLTASDSDAVANDLTKPGPVSDDEVEAVTVLELQQQLAARDGEIEDLRNALEAFEEDEQDASGSRLGGLIGQRQPRNGRIQYLESALTSERERVRSLRAELVASNEKLARQAAHFMDELRRLGGRRGASTALQADEASRRQKTISQKRSLRDRISEDVPAATPASSNDDTPADATKTTQKPRLVAKVQSDDADAAKSAGGGLMARISNLDETD
ncbi:MAG: hypothetical protein AAGC70_17145 [Pseudomonadota bacterium]